MLHMRELLKLLEELTCFYGIESILRHISTGYPPGSFSPKVILDVGCGEGDFMKSLLDATRPMLAVSHTVGLDVFSSCLLRAKEIYTDVIRCDVRFLPFKDASCDVVLASQIIEHLGKNDGLTLIEDLERISNGTVIITAPVGHNPKKHLENNNPWQAHRSTWYPDEFKTRGFSVSGFAGAHFLLGERSEFRIKSKIMEPFLFVISLLTQLITRKLASASYQMLCIKRKIY